MVSNKTNTHSKEISKKKNIHLFSFSFQIRMDKRNVIIAAYNVSKRRQALFYSLYFDFVWERIPQVLKFLIGCCCRDQKTLSVTSCQTTNDSCSGDCGMADWYHVLKLCLENTAGVS